MDIVDSGGLLPLIKLVTSGDIECMKLEGMAMCNLAINSKNHHSMVDAGALPPQIKLAATVIGHSKPKF